MLGERRPQARLADGLDTDAVGVPAPPALAGKPVLAAPEGPAGVWRDPVVWAIAVTVGCAYLLISLLRLRRLAPASWDLAIYTEYVKQLSRLHAPVVDVRGAGVNLLGDHFQAALAVLAPLFRVFPSPATLLFGQAVLTAVSVFPVAAAGIALTGRATGRLIGFAYAFSWGLQQLVNVEFHEIALAVPLLACALSAHVRRRPLAAIGWAMPLVFVKEDQGFTVAAIGVLLGVSAAFPLPASGGWRATIPLRRAGFGTDAGGRYRDGRWGDGHLALWGGLFLVAWGLFWSVLAITVIIPHFSPLHEYYYWKDGGVVGGDQSFSVGGLLGQTADGGLVKLETVALLLLPTAFAALGSPVTLAVLPSLALRFMSTNTAYWGTSWHYNATLMPIVFIAAAEAVARLRARLSAREPGPVAAALGALAGLVVGSFAGPAVRTVVGLTVRTVAGPAVRTARTGIARYAGALMAAVTVALAFQFPLSDLAQGTTYQVSGHVAAADAAIAAVPDGATVQATLDLLAPLAARTDTFWIGNAGNPLTQYVVFDAANSGYDPPITSVPAFIRTRYPRAGYVQVFNRDNVYVFRRR